MKKLCTIILSLLFIGIGYSMQTQQMIAYIKSPYISNQNYASGYFEGAFSMVNVSSDIFKIGNNVEKTLTVDDSKQLYVAFIKDMEKTFSSNVDKVKLLQTPANLTVLVFYLKVGLLEFKKGNNKFNVTKMIHHLVKMEAG